MSTTAPQDWLAMNRRYLAEALEAVRVGLAGNGDTVIALPDPPPGMSPPPALEGLAALFALGGAERFILLLAVGVERDARFADALAEATGASSTALTVGLVAALGGEDAWAALCPQAPLRRWRLVELHGSGPTAQQVVKIDERVLQHLAGIDYLDPRLDGYVEPLAATSTLTATQASAADRLSSRWHGNEAGRWPALQLCGPDADGRRALALALASRRGFRLFRMTSTDIPSSSSERQALARLCDREMALSNGALLLEHGVHTSREDEAQRAARLADSLSGPVIVSAAEPLPLERPDRLRNDLPHPTRGERLDIWQHTLGADAHALGPELERLAEQFRLDGAGIRAAAELTGSRDGANGHRDMTGLWEACRVQARRRLDDLAQRIESGVTWDDIVLPADRLEMLREIASHVRLGYRVYDRWGWAAKTTRGLGVAALFAGPSGTGKTMAAEIMANALSLDLYRIDLSQVVSKYIGETEKNLKRIFEAAEASGAILLFDEADALFGKRSEVKDSHDRYANVEVSYLLQQMEQYRGLAILTTNQKSALDSAFLRRLRFVVDFPFPDARLRAEIWTRIFPPTTPVEGLDIPRLARLTIAGGNIRSVALNAAFLAAGAGGAVNTQHVLTAARREYAKLEKTITTTEFGGES